MQRELAASTTVEQTRPPPLTICRAGSNVLPLMTRRCSMAAAAAGAAALTAVLALEDGEDTDGGDARAGAHRPHQPAVHQAHHRAGQVAGGHILGTLLQ